MSKLSDIWGAKDKPEIQRATAETFDDPGYTTIGLIQYIVRWIDESNLQRWQIEAQLNMSRIEYEQLMKMNQEFFGQSQIMREALKGFYMNIVSIKNGGLPTVMTSDLERNERIKAGLKQRGIGE